MYLLYYRFPIVSQKIHGLQMILPNASLSGTCLMDFQYTVNEFNKKLVIQIECLAKVESLIE